MIIAEQTELLGEKAVALRGVKNFNASRVFDCGQSFRFNETDGIIDGVALGRRIRIKQDGETLFIIGASESDYREVWEKYLGLDEDYERINADIISRFGVYNGVIEEAVRSAHGIRILRQEHFEALCSFIISQNNNIPRIKKLVEALCRACGEKIEGEGDFYAFPTPEAVCALGVEGLAELRMGFRAKYLYDAAQRVVDGRVDLEAIEKMSFAEAEEYLMQIYGVGKKVADCTLLYGYYKTEAFPVDVWIKRVLEKYYPDGIDMGSLGSYAGIAQQYLFCYERYINSGKTD